MNIHHPCASVPATFFFDEIRSTFRLERWHFYDDGGEGVVGIGIGIAIGTDRWCGLYAALDYDWEWITLLGFIIQRVEFGLERQSHS